MKWVSLLLTLLGLFMSPLLWAAKPTPNATTADKLLNSQLEVDRVEVLGVTAFPAKSIESIIELNPGDKLERSKVVRTEENLQSLYVSHGYEEVGIRSRLIRKWEKSRLETVLVFDVNEGRPVRIATRVIVPKEEIKEGSRADWKKRVKQLMSRMSFVEGDILDQEKILESKRAMYELLASKEYVGAKVEHVLVPVTDPQLDTKKVSRWVSVEFHISLGDRVSFGFRGNSVFTWGYLDGIVDEQRLLGLGRDYVGVIKARIESEYKSAGYGKVEITPYTTEGAYGHERKVTYVIKEGPRVSIDSIQFDGNSVFLGEELKQKFLAFAPPLTAHLTYSEKEVRKTAELLVDWMKERGYLAAKLITINAIFLPKLRTQSHSNAVKLVIYIYEGDQTLVQGIKMAGVKVLSQEEVQKLLHVEVGMPLNLVSFAEGIEQIKAIYRERGYLSFRFSNEGAENFIEYSQENRNANILLEAEEGPEFRMSRLEIEGLESTHESIVKRELRFREGEVLSSGALSESVWRLKKLQIFSEVSVRPIDDPGKPGHKIVRVSLKEADRGSLAGGPGFRTDLGIRIFGQLSYSNLWGKNQTASIIASANRRIVNYRFGEGQVQFTYTWPWFGLSELTFRPSISVNRTQYYYFAADVLTVNTLLERQLFSKPNLTGNLSYTFERFLQFNATNTRENGFYQIGTVTPRLSLDLRDSPLAPTQGGFATVWADFAQPFLGSEDLGYYRFQLRGDYYLSLMKDIILSLSFRTGYEQSEVGKKALPNLKKFALGGIYSVRGYQEQEIFNNEELIGKSLSYVNYRTQLDLPFAGSLRFGIFLDAANLLVSEYSLSKQILIGTGFGLHYQTPVGPVNFDIGFKIDPPAGKDLYLIHFSVGIL